MLTKSTSLCLVVALITTLCSRSTFAQVASPTTSELNIPMDSSTVSTARNDSHSLIGQTSTASTNEWSRLAAVELGSKLSIKLKNGKTVEGKLSDFTDSTLSLSIKNKTVEVKREEVRSVHQVKKKSAVTPTLVGFGVGAGVGAAAGALGRANDNDTRFDFDRLDNAIHAGLIVAAAGVGALTGYFVGRTRRKRVLIYQTTEP